ncbi:MAG: hypothetical protein U5K99_01860 [Anaerolineales bacterium]|nr:hypothetical protein [Anaerolineales bacterium]
MSDSNNRMPDNLTSLWVSVEAEEIIELKRISMDRDRSGAVDFFYQVLVPRLLTAARKRGIDLNGILEVESDEHLPG